MPGKASRFSTKHRGSALGKLVDDVLSVSRIESPDTGPNALEFIEDKQYGLGVTLSQVQRVMVKAIYGIPMDFRMGKVPVWDMYKEKLLFTFENDLEYLKYVYGEGRTNISDWREADPMGYATANLVVGRRGGKALSVDEMIPTPSGFKRNGDLVTGDNIFDEHGQVQKVLYAHPIEKLAAYKVSFDDGTFVYANGEHLWHTWTHGERKNARRRKQAPPAKVPFGSCSCGCGQPTNLDRHGSPRRFVSGHQSRSTRGAAITGGIRRTEELLATLKAPTTKSESNHAIPLAAAIHLQEMPLPVDPYCLGVWLGDGHKHSGIITAADEDAEHLKPHFERAGFVFRRLECEKMGWSVLGLRKPLRLLGLINNKHIPQEYLWGSHEQRLSLLQGLMDSDGTCLEDGQAEFCNTNESISRGVYHLASSLGLKPFWTEGRARLYGRDCGPKYCVKWTADLPVFRLPRKLSRIRPTRRPWTHWRYITNIEPAGRMQMRCITTTNPTGLYLFGRNFNVTHNSELVAAMGCVDLRSLLMHFNPQDYYGLLPGSPIDFTLLGTDDESSHTVYDKMRARINACSFFSPYIRQNDTNQMTFVAQADRDNRDIVPSITVAAYPCTTRAVRGPSSYYLALDEFAHFQSSKDANSDEMWKAATPSTSRFPKKEDPERVDSRILMISSPLGKIGKMYEKHKQALTDGVHSTTFTFRCSTVEMYPLIPRQRLAEFRVESKDAYPAEYGGIFLDGAGSYVPADKLQICVDTRRTNTVKFQLASVGRKFFWGLDYATKKDATALAIGHLEMVEGMGVGLIFDYIDRMMVGEAFSGPGVSPEAGAAVQFLTELNIKDIISWLYAMHQVLPCYKGYTDQHGGVTLKQLLWINGITSMDLVHLTDVINSQMYRALQGHILNGTARFPDIEKFKLEFNQLEAEFKSKYVLKVEAPNEEGAHDDMADACALVAWQAEKWLDEEGHLDRDPSGKALMQDPRIMNPGANIIDPNNCSMRDLHVQARMDSLGIGLRLPPQFQIVRDPRVNKYRRF